MRNGFLGAKYDVEHQTIADAFAQSYDVEEDHIGTRIFRRQEEIIYSLLLKANDSQAGETQVKVLDVGCGTGRLEFFLSTKFPKCEITGVDFSIQMLFHALMKGKPEQVKYRQAEAENLPFEDGEFDVVLHAFGVTSYSKQRYCLPEAYRVLRPGGIALFTAYNEIGVNTAVSGLPFRPAMAAEIDKNVKRLNIGGRLIACKTFTTDRFQNFLDDVGFQVMSIETFPVLSALLPENALLELARSEAQKNCSAGETEQILFQMEKRLAASRVFEKSGMYILATARKPEQEG